MIDGTLCKILYSLIVIDTPEQLGAENHLRECH